MYPPFNRSAIVVLPGQNARISLRWTFVGDPSRAILVWYFTRSGSSKEEELAEQFRNNAPVIYNSSLPGLAIEYPATLVLKNVNRRFNGIYRLLVAVAGGGGVSSVALFIPGKYFKMKL